MTGNKIIALTLAFILVTSVGTIPTIYGIQNKSSQESPDTTKTIRTDVMAPQSAQVDQLIKQRIKDNLPFAKGTFSTEVFTSKNSTTIITTSEFPNTTPEEWGLTEWPSYDNKLVTGPLIDAKTGITLVQTKGSIDEFIKNQVISQAKNGGDLKKGDSFDLKKHPRKITFSETITTHEIKNPEKFLVPINRDLEIKEPTSNNPVDNITINVNEFNSSDPNEPIQTERDILMGFTHDPPGFNWQWHDRETVCFFKCWEVFEGWVTLDFGYTIGLRLPATIRTTTPRNMPHFEDSFFSAKLKSKNFSTEDYEKLGIAPHDGKEFYATLDFEASIVIELADYEVLDKGPNVHLDLGKSCTEARSSNISCEDFFTPIGYDENGKKREFPIPSVVLNNKDTGLYFEWYGASLGVDLKIDPDFGSDTITANWNATGETTGTGTIVFTSEAMTQEDIGPIYSAPLPSDNQEPHSTYVVPGTDTLVTSIDESSDTARPFQPGVVSDSSDLSVTMGGTTMDVEGILTVDDFTFVFDRMIINLLAQINPGGWVDFIPNSGYFKVMSVDLTDIVGEPELHQHSGTSGIIVGLDTTKSKCLECARDSPVANDVGGFSMEPSDKTVDALADIIKEIPATSDSSSQDIVDKFQGHLKSRDPTFVKNLASEAVVLTQDPKDLPSPDGIKEWVKIAGSLPDYAPKGTGTNIGIKIKSLQEDKKDLGRYTQGLKASMLPRDKMISSFEKFNKEKDQQMMMVKTQGIKGGLSELPIPKLWLPPGTQMKNGLLPDEIICNPGFVKLDHMSKNQVICVSPSSEEKIIERLSSDYKAQKDQSDMFTQQALKYKPQISTTPSNSVEPFSCHGGECTCQNSQDCFEMGSAGVCQSGTLSCHEYTEKNCTCRMKAT